MDHDRNCDKQIYVHVIGIKSSYLMSRFMRKQDFCLCKNKGTDQLCSNCTADQRLCFRYTDSTISLLSKSKISSFQPSSVVVQVGLCQALSETRKTGFLMTLLLLLKCNNGDFAYSNIDLG